MEPSFNHFNDLSVQNLNIEYHMHTNQTDGKDSIEKMLRAASDKGIRQLAFTEHIRADSSWFDEFKARVKQAAELYPDIDVLIGVETKVIDLQGDLDISVDVLSKADIILGSVHSIPDSKGGVIPFSDLSPRELASIEFELAKGMLKHAPIDVLAHPGGMYASRYGGFPIHYIKELMYLAKVNDKAIEFSSKYAKNPYDFLTACGEINPQVSIGSDAHEAGAVGQCQQMLIDFDFVKFQRRD